MKISLLITIQLLLLLAVKSQPTGFENQMQDFLKQPDYKNATVGMHVIDIKSGESLYSLNAEQLMIPASTLKLVTSATALELLGAGYRFQTKIGYTGNIRNEELNGDLVIIGGGDPTLGSEYFEDYYFKPDFLENWVREIRNAGIEKINGDLFVDLSLYDSEINPPTWVWEDIGNYYGAGSSALTVYDNLFRISFRSPAQPGRKTDIISVSPEIDGMTLENEVVSANIKYDQAYVFGSPIDKNRVVRGAIPKGRTEFTIKAAMPNPERVLADELLKKLAEAGVSFSGNVRTKNVAKRNMHILFIQQSPPLEEIVKVLNFESVNLFAEHLVRQIAAEATGTGSREKGIHLIKEFWDLHGLDKEDWFMEDGSGLSHFNAISPQQITQLLEFMYTKSQSRNAFLNSLASTGEGTLIYWDRNKFPGNSLQAKSGSMTRVRCYAGYLDTDSGKKVAFSIMVNHFAGAHAKLIHEIEDLLYKSKSDIK